MRETVGEPKVRLNLSARRGLLIGASLVLALQWVVLRLCGVVLAPAVTAAAAGSSILGAAFLLSWSAEVAQLDVPQALALAFLAFVAVLPEYSVDLYFAWQAGQDPSYTKFATANMTGANRLLIGLGWAGVVYAWWLRSRQTVLDLGDEIKVELAFLGLATLYSFIIPVKGSLGLVDALVLLGLFCGYVVAAARSEQVIPEIEGPAELIAALQPGARRVVVFGLFLVAALVIVAAAEPFAEGLLATGRRLGIEEFILVQWLAPLASEAPEFAVAIIFALRGRPRVGMGTLISSKVNQWTLLIGALPIAYSLSAGHLQPMQLDARQTEEIFLTSAQSLLAVVIIADLRFSLSEAGLIALLFAAQMVTTSSAFRLYFAVAYVVLAVGLLLARRESLRMLVHLLALRFLWRPRR